MPKSVQITPECQNFAQSGRTGGIPKEILINFTPSNSKLDEDI